MRSEKHYKMASCIGVIGLILIFTVILSNSAYPSMIFRILAPLGILLVFISVALLSISFLLTIKESFKRKDYITTVIIIAIGLLYIFKVIR